MTQPPRSEGDRIVRVTPASTALIRAYAVYHPVFIAVCCWLISRGEYAPLEVLGMTLTAGFLGGAAFNVAHELVHRKPRTDGALATVLLCAVTYPTFKLEHVGHHHKWVATDADPSSAARNVSIYAHLPRAIVLNVVNAARVGYRRSKSVGWRNEFIRVLVLQAVTYVAVGVAFGGTATLFFLGQSLTAIAWLENANYFQHYGLRRRVVDGRPEPVTPRHAWDVDQPLLNTLWLNLPLHSHHHVSPAVSFDRLAPSATSPKYPVGYVTCTFLALFPALWTRFAEALLSSQLGTASQGDRR